MQVLRLHLLPDQQPLQTHEDGPPHRLRLQVRDVRLPDQGPGAADETQGLCPRGEQEQQAEGMRVCHDGDVPGRH